jgi:DNA-binding CsgD family transcriptional regulator
MNLCAAVLSADHVRLVLSCEGADSGATYELGTRAGAEDSRTLELADNTSATLFFGGGFKPSPGILQSIAASLAVILDSRMLRNQTAVLRAALESTSSSVLLFDRHGDIVFANPPADRLLSLQTEDELLVATAEGSIQPLFTVLSSIVGRVGSASEEKAAWRGALESLDGRALACEVTRLTTSGSLPETVLVLLQQIGSEPAARIDAFCANHNLSPREKEVVKLLVEGLTTLAMAEKLGISPHTVRDHLKNLYRKTGTKSRSELLGLASRTVPAGTGIST